jgi:hypothetical protein
MVGYEFAVLVLSTCDNIVHDQPLHLGTLQHLHTHNSRACCSGLQVCDGPASSNELTII